MGMEKQKPMPADLFTDEDLSILPPDVKVTALGLHLHADDQGRESTTLWRLRAAIWAGHPEVTEETLVEHLLQLDELGFIGIYSVGERTYYAIRVFPAPSHPKPSKHPAPPADLFQRTAGSPPDDRSAWERESAEQERARGESPRWTTAGIPPSPFCRDHQPAGSGGKPCVHCQDARLAHEMWIREDRAAGRSQG